MTTLTGVFAVLVAGACSLSSNRKIIVISIANSALMATVQGASHVIYQQAIFRAAFLAALFLHESAHLLMAVLLAKKTTGILTWANATVNTSFMDLVQCSLPFLPLPTTFNPHVRVAAFGNEKQKSYYFALIEVFGACFSTLAALTLCYNSNLADHGTVAAFILVATLSLLSDTRALLLLNNKEEDDAAKAKATVVEPWSKAVWTFYCGNFGIIIAGSETDMKLDVFGVLKEMAKICMMRGAQSGGIAAFMSKQESGGKEVTTTFRSRVSASKRDNLAIKLSRDFKKQAIQSRYLKYAPVNPQNMDIGLFVGHTRFATSSIPLASETHPHQYTPPSAIACTHWVANSDGKWTSTPNARAGVFITHNGDFEFYELFGVERTFGQVQQWLTAVLGRAPPASCDSIGIAGVFEYLRTQGLWPQSLRLAYQQRIVKSFDEALGVSHANASSGGKDIELDSSDGSGPPAWKDLHAVGEALSTAFASFVAKSPSGDCKLVNGGKSVSFNSTDGSAAQQSEDGLLKVNMRKALNSIGGKKALVAEFQQAVAPLAKDVRWLNRILASGQLDDFLETTIDNFIDNDLYTSIVTFYKHARGSFGMAVICDLDPDRVVMAALNQTLSVAFVPSSRAVTYSSETQVAMVNTAEASGLAPEESTASNGWRHGHPTARIDLNSGEGEICQLVFKSGSTPKWEEGSEGWNPLDGDDADYCRIQMYNLRQQVSISKETMLDAGRIVNLVDNIYVDFAPPVDKSNKQDLIAQDLNDIPSLLNTIHESFQDPGALNSGTMEAFLELLVDILDRKASGKMDLKPGQAPPIDILITGVEVSLWVAEQFASDLQIMFPSLKATAISSNKLISVVGNARGQVSPTGFCFTMKEGTFDPTHTIALAISHSGQTFPTMHAAKILETALPKRVFVLSGSYDTQMGLAVGHKLDAEAKFCNRMFSTFAGWRGAEPPSVTVAALHHTLTEILVFCADSCSSGVCGDPSFVSLNKVEMKDFVHVLHDFSTKSVQNILGVDQNKQVIESQTHKDLLKMGDKWSWHVLEGPIAFIMGAAYIIGTVVSGYPLFSGIARGAGLTNMDAIYVLKTLDAFLYIYIWHLSCLFLRLITGRDILARFGKRTIICADVPYINQTLEAFVSKLFALSYGIATVDVHGCNPADHFVHRFTHRVARGVLIAAGRPDGRLCSQTTTESSVLLALTQAHVIRNSGCAPEVLTVGHNPFYPKAAQDHGIVLPSNRDKFLCEALVSTEDPLLLEPSQRLAKVASMMEDAEKFIKPGSGTERVKTCIHDWLDTATEEYPYVVGIDVLRPPQIECLAKTAGKRLGDPLAYIKSLGPQAAAIIDEVDDTEAENKGGEIETIQDILEGQSQLEQLMESRCLSLERLLAFEVLFHRMAQRVASFWPLHFDISRSQSGLRICTTAGPVSASDLVREYEETIDFYARSKTFAPAALGGRSMTSSTSLKYNKSMKSSKSFGPSRSSRRSSVDGLASTKE